MRKLEGIGKMRVFGVAENAHDVRRINFCWRVLMRRLIFVMLISIVTLFGGVASLALAAGASPQSIEEATVTLNQDVYIYDGTAHMPIPTVMLNEETLTAGRDYSVRYAFNTNAGRGRVTITGRGEYTGSKNVYFTILQALPSIEVPEGSISRRAITAGIENGSTPSGQISYTYYTDESLQTLTSSENGGASTEGGKPTEDGTYYVRATLQAAGNYAKAISGVQLLSYSSGDNYEINGNYYSTLAEAFQACNDGWDTETTIYVLNDCYESQGASLSLGSYKTVTLDLNGYNIYVDGNDNGDACFIEAVSGNFNLISSAAGRGVIVLNADYNTALLSVRQEWNSASVTIDNVDLRVDTGMNPSAIYAYNMDVTIRNSTIYQGDTYSSASNVIYFSGYSATLELQEYVEVDGISGIIVEGGSFVLGEVPNDGDAVGISAFYPNVSVKNGYAVTLTNGATMTFNNGTVGSYDGASSIEGVISGISSTDISVPEGYSLTSDYYSEGYYVYTQLGSGGGSGGSSLEVDQSEANYQIVDQNGEYHYYATLNNAFAGAAAITANDYWNDSIRITLLHFCEETTSAIIPASATINITLDLQSYNITVKGLTGTAFIYGEESSFEQLSLTIAGPGGIILETSTNQAAIIDTKGIGYLAVGNANLLIYDEHSGTGSRAISVTRYHGDSWLDVSIDNAAIDNSKSDGYGIYINQNVTNVRVEILSGGISSGYVGVYAGGTTAKDLIIGEVPSSFGEVGPYSRPSITGGTYGVEIYPTVETYEGFKNGIIKGGTAALSGATMIMPPENTGVFPFAVKKDMGDGMYRMYLGEPNYTLSDDDGMPWGFDTLADAYAFATTLERDTIDISVERNVTDASSITIEEKEVWLSLRKWTYNHQNNIGD